MVKKTHIGIDNLFNGMRASLDLYFDLFELLASRIQFMYIVNYVNMQVNSFRTYLWHVNFESLYHSIEYYSELTAKQNDPFCFIFHFWFFIG